MKCISRKAFIANLDLIVPIKHFALPLIILLVFSSLSESIWIIAISTILASISAYFTGKFKDKNSEYLSMAALFLAVAVWFFYGFASGAISFIILGVFESISSTIILVGREARLSREIANTKKPIEATIEVEVARMLGPIISFAILTLIYIITNSLPQIVLVLGSLLILPNAIYSVGNLDKYKARK